MSIWSPKVLHLNNLVPYLVASQSVQSRIFLNKTKTGNREKGGKGWCENDISSFLSRSQLDSKLEINVVT